MTILTESSLAGMLFTLCWKSDGVSHEEYYYAADVNMWRDIFPDSLRKKLIGCRPGDEVMSTFAADELIEKWARNGIRTVPLHSWQPHSVVNTRAQPLAGRHYPSGFLHGVSGIYPQSLTPIRVVDVSDSSLTVDLGHPLAGKELALKIQIRNISTLKKERGGRCSNRISDMLENGPGMEGRHADSPIHYDQQSAYFRQDPGADDQFYREPRLVSHIDSRAGRHLQSALERFLKPGGRVLDLMASVDSHLPAENGFDVIGLGMNSNEMAANPSLSGQVVHNLNDNPILPFDDSEFDAVMCNLSIEYLTRPEEVISEAARVVKPSGTLLFSFSNRWFPPKVTRLWTELHEFERMGLVAQYCWTHCREMTTLSYRNWPRPETDAHFPSLLTSDPLYVVTGKAEK